MKLKEMMKKGITFALAAFVAIAPVNVSAASWQQNNHGWWWQEDDSSYPTNTWKDIYGKWYYFDDYGYMLGEGWHWINDKCYYMYAGGSMASNTWIDGSYVNGSGAWVPNAQPAQWKYSTGRWWYQNEDGSYPTNEWEPINGAWYYFDAEGWMLGEGWHWINDKCYYMYADGSMASDTWINGSYVDASGAWVPNKCDHVWEKKYEDIEHPEEGHTEHVLITPEKGHTEHVLITPEKGHIEHILISPEKGHYEKVTEKDQWIENVPEHVKDKYEIHYLCNGCRKDFGKGDKGYEDINAHVEEQMLSGNFECGGWHEEQVLVEKWIIDKEAVYEDKWIVDKEAVYEDKWIVDEEAVYEDK